MAKDSDKKRVLERRRTELLHAIKHEANAETIAKCVTKLKSAVFGVAKKELVRGRTYVKYANNSEWQMVHRCWESFTVQEVIAIVSSWGERPSYKDIMLACRDKNDMEYPKAEDGA